MLKIIGGDFEIDPLAINECSGEEKGQELWYSSGRAALHYILQNVKQLSPQIDSILLPDYLCQSIVETVSLNKFRIKYYKLTADLEIDRSQFSSIYSNRDVVLIINYFGIINTETQINFIRQLDPKSCIILDNVQAFYEMYHPTVANYSFTSLRKWFPIPDGAIVRTSEPGMFSSIAENSFAPYKLAGSILKKYRNIGIELDNVYLSLFEKGEEELPKNLDAKASKLSMLLFYNLNLKNIAARRQRNAKYVVDALGAIGINPIVSYSEDRVPLFIPLRIPNRDTIRNYLTKKRIYCPIHWPPVSQELSMGKDMFAHELSIVIDQRYDMEDMSYIISCIKQCQSKL